MTSTRRRATPSVILLVASAMLTGCGGTPDSITTPPDLPLSSRDDLSSLEKAPWQSWETVDDTTLELVVLMGTPACWGVHVVLVEDDTEVIVGVQTGTLPEAVGAQCTADGAYLPVRVPLSAPLGSREVKDPYAADD